MAPAHRVAGWPWLGTVSVTGPCGWSCSGDGVEGLEPAVTVPRGERNNSVYEVLHVRADAGQWPPGDRGPLLGKQEARISRDLPGHPPATRPASANSRSLCLSPAARLSVSLSVCPSEREAQDPSFKAKPLSSQPTVRASPWGLPLRHVCPQVTWRWTPRYCLPEPSQAPPGDRHQRHGGGGSVRSRPAGASVRAASDLRPRGTEKDIASHVWGRRVGAEGAAKAASGPPPAQEPCRASGSAVTKLLLPGHMVQPVGPPRWAGVHTWPALTPAHPPHVLACTPVPPQEGPCHSAPLRPAPPHFLPTSAGGGAQLAPPGAGPSRPVRAALPSTAGTCHWVPGAGQAVATAPRPPAHTEAPTPPRASLPAPAVTSIPLLGGWVSRDVREEGRRMHGGSVSPGVQPLGQVPDSPCAICCLPQPTRLRSWGGARGDASQRGMPRTRGLPKLVSVQARWSTRSPTP